MWLQRPMSGENRTEVFHRPTPFVSTHSSRTQHIATDESAAVGWSPWFGGNQRTMVPYVAICQAYSRTRWAPQLAWRLKP